MIDEKADDSGIDRDGLTQDERQIASLQQQINVRDARITALTAANVDLHSRLDELRRVFAPVSPLVSMDSQTGRVSRWPVHHGSVRVGDGLSRTTGDETASGRLAEHARRTSLLGDDLTPDPPPS